MPNQSLDVLPLIPIGYYQSEQSEPYQAGRQPDGLGENGCLILKAGQQYEQALQDLAGCSHLWIIFGFHQNSNWKPLVKTPRSQRKIGVFATRSPYRPNPIGLSLVKLVNVNKLKITIEACDLLNGSPIYDIKPYHPDADRAEYPRIQWLEDSLTPSYQIRFSPRASEQIEWLERISQSGSAFEKKSCHEIKNFILRQLEYDPINKDKKRLEEQPGYWTLCYRTWRIDFTITEQMISILGLRSGYTTAELVDGSDPYHDKQLHRNFNREYT